MAQLLIWLAVGGGLGWAVDRLFPDARQGLLWHLVFGVLGAWLGVWLISPWLGLDAGDANTVDPYAVGASALGALLLLFIVKLLHSRAIR